MLTALKGKKIMNTYNKNIYHFFAPTKEGQNIAILICIKFFITKNVVHFWDLSSLMEISLENVFTIK